MDYGSNKKSAQWPEMKTGNLTIFIPALKKNVAFQDDLVKKLAGVTLVQRAINKAQELGVAKKDIHLLTDSEEIRLIAERNGISVYWDSELVWDAQVLKGRIYSYLRMATKHSENTLLLSPYAPLLSSELLEQAIEEFEKSQRDILKPVKVVRRQLFDSNAGIRVIESIIGTSHETHRIESNAFTIMKSSVISMDLYNKSTLFAWEVEHDLLEIDSFQDWWVCEKLLQKKRIIFRIIGDEKVGMGHIYRALSLAHEITDHEILFVSDTNSTVAVNKLAGYDYWLGIYEPEDIIQQILELQPDLVINDILSTTKEDVRSMQINGIKVVNFEDLGAGASLSDLTINELYDEPQIDGENILWGQNYFILRDEFFDATPHHFKRKVDSILLAFGGTDPCDLSRKIYHVIESYCQHKKIYINIVAGHGYKGFERLAKEIEGKQGVTLTRATGVISSIMERSQLALVSNGRTVYELAHMNIPAIVIAQHERENTHNFSCKENGFVPIGLYNKGITEKKVQVAFERLLDDTDYRRTLFERTTRYRFNSNKQHLLKRILYLLEQSKESKTH